MEFLLPGGAFVVGVAILVLVLGYATAMLRDQLIPQLPPSAQTFSLSRVQMAWWLIIILGSYVFLGATGNGAFHILNAQAALLLGLSVATSGGSAAVDAARDTPEDMTNRALQQLGLNSYDDVVALRDTIPALQALAKHPGPQRAAALAKLNNANNVLKTYDEKTAKFRTKNFFADMVTDIDGTALHRLQALVWTFVFGLVFVLSVCRHKQLPVFDQGMLALMGISSAGYVGFKYNETQY